MRFGAVVQVGRQWAGERIRVPWWGFAIAVFEILGGLSCLGALAQGAVHNSKSTLAAGAIAVVLTLVLWALSAAAVAAGVLLLMRRGAGWRLSRVIQATQLLQFDILGVRFLFAPGASVTAGISSWDITFGYRVGSDAAFLVGGELGPFTLVANLVASILFTCLFDTPEALVVETPAHRQPAN